MISTTTIDQVRDLSIVDVVGKYVDLKKVGSTYRSNSPFTNEKTPSFYVVPAKQIFKCFSSGKGGDGITFVMEKEGVSYVDAIKTLCGQFNISIQYESNGQPTEHYEEIELLYKINHATANLYAKELLNVDGNHPAFEELINRRRFTADTLLQWQIGYAPGEVGQYTPSKWNLISKLLVSKGYYQQGADLGLIKTKNEVTYDVFRSRIMFPIIDHQGRYVAFGGRAVKPDAYNAKYLNSPESKIFYKSKVLFGLHFAAHEIRKKGYANLMEGYTDVISFHQAGQVNTVGTCGTALTEDQARLLRKYTNKIVLIYDPDEAGQSAAARSSHILMQHGFECSIVPMLSIIRTQRGREMMFVTHRTKESLWCKYNGEEIELPINEVEAIEKVDPDELVRMF